MFNWIIYILVSTLSQPIFTSISFFLVKNKINSFIIFMININKFNLMFNQITKIFLCFFICWCTKTFIIFNFPSFKIVIYWFTPSFKVLQCEKWMNLSSFSCFDNRSNKLFQENIRFDKRRPKSMNKIDNKSFNMRTIMILISHNHQRSITKRIYIFISFSKLKTHNLY